MGGDRSLFYSQLFILPLSPIHHNFEPLGFYSSLCTTCWIARRPKKWRHNDSIVKRCGESTYYTLSYGANNFKILFTAKITLSFHSIRTWPRSLTEVPLYPCWPSMQSTKRSWRPCFGLTSSLPSNTTSKRTKWSQLAKSAKQANVFWPSPHCA